MWKSFLAVGMGGFVGACMRFAISSIETKWDFPVMTLLVNFLGAVLIGMIAELATEWIDGSSNGVLFFKTGVCGGFTTFSTFSLETIGLFENKQNLLACGYVASSVVLCLAGVILGKVIVRSVMTLAGVTAA